MMSNRSVSCRQFADRLQRCADERRAAADDNALTSHANECDRCDADLRAWAKIESLLLAHVAVNPPATGPSTIKSPAADRRRGRRLASPGWTVAATVMMVMAAGAYQQLGRSGASVGNSLAMNSGVGPMDVPGGDLVNDASRLWPTVPDPGFVADRNVDHTDVNNVDHTDANIDMNLDADIDMSTNVNIDLDPAIWWQGVRNRDWVGHTMPAIESVQRGVAPLGRTLIRAVTILTTGGPLPGEPAAGVEGQTS